MIDVYASLPHYWAHIKPVWDALPEGIRGEVYAPRHGLWGRGLPARWPSVGPIMVAGFADAVKVRPRPVIYVEHGAGQSYPGDPASAGHGSYSGGSGLHGVVLFVCPGEAVANRWRIAYPDVPVVAVGSPRLDPLLHAKADPSPAGWELTRMCSRPNQMRATVVSTTLHWDCPLIPETRSAWAHYRRRMIPQVSRARDSGWSLVGHGHPRAASQLAGDFLQLGVDWQPDLGTVLASSDVIVADNTSAMWEAAALDIPLVILDAPWYRRDVDHGLRFWEFADVGVRISEPDQLCDAIEDALEDTASRRDMRAAAAGHVYARRDGRSAAAAVAAILEVL